MKLCKVCLEMKPFEQSACTPKLIGFKGRTCWPCHCKASLQYHNAKNATPEGKAANTARGLQWAKENPGRHTAKVMAYKAAKIHRTPPWSDLKQIRTIYELAASEGKTVDHIVPLRGELVSGLHVPWNLQIISKTENSSKGNSFSPS